MGANLDGVKNIPLFIALCSSFFIYPIIELIVAKQYNKEEVFYRQKTSSFIVIYSLQSLLIYSQSSNFLL